MLVCAFLCATCTRDRGCSAHPAFPAPSFLEGTDVDANLGQTVPREGGRMPSGVRILKPNFSASLRGAIATKQSSPPRVAIWIASRSLSSGARSRDPLARNDEIGHIDSPANSYK